MPRRTFHTQTPLEALLVEQALLLARQLQKTADDAADGQVLAAVEATAVPATREFARKAVEATLQQQAHAAEKRGVQLVFASTATNSPATRATPGDPSGRPPEPSGSTGCTRGARRAAPPATLCAVQASNRWAAYWADTA